MTGFSFPRGSVHADFSETDEGCGMAAASRDFLLRVCGGESRRRSELGFHLPAASQPLSERRSSIGYRSDAQAGRRHFSPAFRTICFVPPVQGKVTGAVFVGEGLVILDPPLAVERSSLKLLTREDEFAEHFSKLVLRFTDGSYDEIKKSGTAASGGCNAEPLRDTQNAMRHDRMLKYNLDARILEDVLSPEAGGLFVAFIHGKKYNDKEIFVIDPHGAPPLL